MIRYLKKNPILATADWLFVQKTIDIQSPFDDKKEEFIKENVISKRHMDMIKCDHCQAHVTIPISKFEFKQTFEDCRVRILRLESRITRFLRGLEKCENTFFWPKFVIMIDLF
jgi:hypothetical protein